MQGFFFFKLRGTGLTSMMRLSPMPGPSRVPRWKEQANGKEEV